MRSVFENITDYMHSRGIAHRCLEHDPVYTTEQAEGTVGHAPSEGTKSLALESECGLAVATVSGSERLDFGAIKRILGVRRLRMHNRSLLHQDFGVDDGGLAPFGYQPGIEILISETLIAEERIFFNPGRNDLTIEVTGVVFKEMAEHWHARIATIGAPQASA